MTDVIAIEHIFEITRTRDGLHHLAVAQPLHRGQRFRHAVGIGDRTVDGQRIADLCVSSVAPVGRVENLHVLHWRVVDRLHVDRRGGRNTGISIHVDGFHQNVAGFGVRVCGGIGVLHSPQCQLEVRRVQTCRSCQRDGVCAIAGDRDAIGGVKVCNYRWINEQGLMQPVDRIRQSCGYGLRNAVLIHQLGIRSGDSDTCHAFGIGNRVVTTDAAAVQIDHGCPLDIHRRSCGGRGQSGVIGDRDGDVALTHRHVRVGVDVAQPFQSLGIIGQ